MKVRISKMPLLDGVTESPVGLPDQLPLVMPLFTVRTHHQEPARAESMEPLVTVLGLELFFLQLMTVVAINAMRRIWRCIGSKVFAVDKVGGMNVAFSVWFCGAAILNYGSSLAILGENKPIAEFVYYSRMQRRR